MTDQTQRDDLVERLRLNFGIWSDWPDSANRVVIRMNTERYEAADRIERLERALGDAERLIAGFVRRYAGMQDGNGHEPTEMRRAKRLLAALKGQEG